MRPAFLLCPILLTLAGLHGALADQPKEHGLVRERASLRGMNAQFSGGRPVQTCPLDLETRPPVRCNAGFGTAMLSGPPAPDLNRRP